MQDIVASASEKPVLTPSSDYIVIAFEPVQLVVALASEQVVEPPCAEDFLVVAITDPFNTSDVADFKFV